MNDLTDNGLVIGVMVFLLLLSLSMCILFGTSRCTRNQEVLLD